VRRNVEHAARSAHVPLGGPVAAVSTTGTWPRASALGCHPVALTD